MDEPGNQVLAVQGSPGSGKSTVAVELARYLAGKKRNVILLTCDMTAPILPYICPPADLEYEQSLRSMLVAAQAMQSLVRYNLITHKKYDYLTMMGMLRGENEYTCPSYNTKQATELIAYLREVAPYVIIDCGSYTANDIPSTIALMESDAVFRLVNCDSKSISYLSSQLPLLRDNKWGAEKQYKVASNIRPNEASEYVGQVLGSVTFKLPYCVELTAQSPAGDLLADLSLRESKGFRKVIEAINREVFGYQGENAPGIYWSRGRSGELVDRQQWQKWPAMNRKWNCRSIAIPKGLMYELRMN